MNCDSVNFKPCFSQDACYGSDALAASTSTSSCWIFLFVQLVLALVFLLSSSCFGLSFSFVASCLQRESHQEKEEEKEKRIRDRHRRHLRSTMILSTNAENAQKKNTSYGIIKSKRATAVFFDDTTPSTELSKTTEEEFLPNETKHDVAPTKRFEENGSQKEEHIEEEEIISSPFVETHRSESNFLKKNDDPAIQYPSSYTAEYVLLDRSALSILRHTYRSFIEQKQMQKTFLNSAGLAFLSSSLTSLLILLFKYEDELEDFCPEIDGTFLIKRMVQGSSKALSSTIDAYKFLPLFLLIAYTAFLVDRWRTFLVTCHMIQGSIHNIGLLCGSAPDTPVTTSSKKKLYKIYRYLNVIHALCLKNFSAALHDMSIEVDYVNKLGLLTMDETILVLSMENKARDGMLTLLAHMIGELLRESTKPDTVAKSTVLNEKVCNLRGNCARLHDLFLRDNPNEYIMFMNVLTFIFGCLVVLGYPILMMSYTSYDDSSCIQPGIWFGVFFVQLSISLPSALFDALQNPFDKDGDRIDVDNLMASSDLCLFQNLRTLWHFDKDMKASITDTRPFSQTTLLSRKNFAKSHKGGYGEM